MREKRRKARRRKILSTLIPVVLLLVVLFVVLVFKGFVVKEVEVVGNEIYTDDQIEAWALNDEYSWNSLYVVLKNRLQRQEEIPFVDSMTISLKSLTKIQIQVEEKGILGYVYVSSLEQYAYFDQEGFVVELSEKIIDDTMKISGLSIEEATLYEKLDVSSSLLKKLLTLTQLLEKYDCIPNQIYISGSTFLLDYDDLQVNLGDGTSLSEKVLRMNEILSSLTGESGTLHFDTWTESDTDVYFKKGELTTLPKN